MDHIEAREILEMAAAEPGGVARLEAGDTPEAIAVASHLVDCASCRAEWERLSALSQMLHDTLGETERAAGRLAEPVPVAAATSGQAASFAAPPELRERTLRYVRELGVPRGEGASMRGATHEPSTTEPAATEPTTVSIAPLGAPVVPLVGWRARRAGHWRGIGELVGLAAAIVLIAGLGAFAAVRDQQAHQQEEAQASLRAVNSALLALASEQADVASAKDAARVSLASADGTATGWVLYSALRDQMIMVASGLPQPAGGDIVRCWVQTQGGAKRVLGDVVFEGDLAYWSGWPQGGLGDVKPGATFGVSIVEPGQAPGSGRVLMTGTVGG